MRHLASIRHGRCWPRPARRFVSSSDTVVYIFIFGNVGRGVQLVWCRNASTGPAFVSLPWPLFQNYNGPLLASHDGASMAAGTGPSKVLCIMLNGMARTFSRSPIYSPAWSITRRVVNCLGRITAAPAFDCPLTHSSPSTREPGTEYRLA